MILNLLASIAVAIGAAGQFADGYTTYQGVKIAGPSIEGDKSWLAQFIVNHFPYTLALKPTAFGALGATLIALGNVTDGGSVFMAFALSMASAIIGFVDARNNAKINKTLKPVAKS
jgi:hypothetical protein